MKNLHLAIDPENVGPVLVEAYADALIENEGNVNADTCLTIEEIARNILGNFSWDDFVENVNERVAQKQEEG